jgi:hypothetical protein
VRAPSIADALGGLYEIHCRHSLIVAASYVFHGEHHGRAAGFSLICLPKTRKSLDPALRHASQMHWEAYVRFIAVTLLATAFYAYYGQHHGGAAGTGSTAYQKINGGDHSQESS